MRKILIVLFIIFLCSSAQAQDVNYCHDEQSWEEWNQLVLRYPNDRDVQILHALRIGLCKKVEQNTIRMGEAIEIFNAMVDTVANKRESGDTEKQTL